MHEFIFLFLGVFVGLMGTLIGVGGGFLLSPIFIYMYPFMPASQLTAMSLLAISVNAISGSIGYTFRKQIHWKSVLFFSAASIPGVYIGVELVKTIDRNFFNFLFGVLLIVMGIFIFYRSMKKNQENTENKNFWSLKGGAFGSGISFFVGILSSLMGIGGGIIHVPLLSEFLKYPVHIAVGTSQFILAITSVNAVVHHYQIGSYSPLNPILPFLCLGLVFGAQAGAYYSKKISSKFILRILSSALFIVGLQLFFRWL